MPKILVIDDDEIQLKLLSDILVREGYTVYSTADGPRGVVLYKAHWPDLILLDLALPSMTGMEVVEQIRSFDPRAKVIIVTGYPSVESTVRSLQLGAIDVVPKPVNVEALLKKIAVALRPIKS